MPRPNIYTLGRKPTGHTRIEIYNLVDRILRKDGMSTFTLRSIYTHDLFKKQSKLTRQTLESQIPKMAGAGELTVIGKVIK